jgi:hypothetical protein
MQREGQVERLLRETTRKRGRDKDLLAGITDRAAFGLVIVGITWGIASLFPTDTPSVVRGLFQATLVAIGAGGMVLAREIKGLGRG